MGRHSVRDAPVRQIRPGSPRWRIFSPGFQFFQIAVDPAGLVAGRRGPALRCLVIIPDMISSAALLQVLHGRNPVAAVVVIPPVFQRGTGRGSLEHHGIRKSLCHFRLARNDLCTETDLIVIPREENIVFTGSVQPVCVGTGMPGEPLFDPAQPHQIAVWILQRIEPPFDPVVFPFIQRLVIMLFEDISADFPRHPEIQCHSGNFRFPPGRSHVPINLIHSVKPQLSLP